MRLGRLVSAALPGEGHSEVKAGGGGQPGASQASFLCQAPDPKAFSTRTIRVRGRLAPGGVSTAAG